MPHTLLISGKEIRKFIPMRHALRLVENVFRAQAQGRVQMPAKIYIHLDKYRGDFRAMPSYIEGMEACGIKWVNVHPENKKYGLPAVMAVIILSDPKTGVPRAIMDGTHITNVRTGAAGGIGAKYLARKNSTRVALIGCGKQAEMQLSALRELFSVKEVFCYDRITAHAQAFIKKMKRANELMRLSATIKEALSCADIVVTSTPSRTPIIKAGWIKKGTHINAIGADAKGKEELEPALLKRARVFIDDRAQAEHSGEINVPFSKKLITRRDIRATLGEVIIGKKKGRITEDDITVFDSTGLSIQDVAVADFVFRAARNAHAGRYIQF